VGRWGLAKIMVALEHHRARQPGRLKLEFLYSATPRPFKLPGFNPSPTPFENVVLGPLGCLPQEGARPCGHTPPAAAAGSVWLPGRAAAGGPGHGCPAR
jgi:hypothetical protein